MAAKANKVIVGYPGKIVFMIILESYNSRSSNLCTTEECIKLHVFYTFIDAISRKKVLQALKIKGGIKFDRYEKINPTSF